MKENIPTRKITVGKGEEIREVEVYEWMTQDETDGYQAVILGDQDIELQTGGEAPTMKMRIQNLAESRKYLVEHQCKDLAWDDLNTWKPELRDELFNKLNEVREVIEKK